MGLKLRCVACGEESLAFPGFEVARPSVLFNANDARQSAEDRCECNRLLHLLKNSSVSGSSLEESSLAVPRMLGLTTGGGTSSLMSQSKAYQLSAKICPWNYLQVEFADSVPYSNPDLVWLAPTLVMILSETTVRGDFRVENLKRRTNLNKHSIALVPVGDVGRWSTPDPCNIMQIWIHPPFVAELAGSLGLDERFELPFLVPADDAFLKASMLALHSEVSADYASGKIYGDAIGTALAVHLLGRYNLQSRKANPSKGRLGANALALVTDFIAANYDQDIGLNQLCLLVNLSPFHFSRMFKESTGLSPYQYLLQFRVNRSRELLQSGATVKQAARAVGFWDTSHLTRHFKKLYGYAPSEVISRDY